MGVYSITLHGSGKVCIIIKPHFIDLQMSEGGAGMEVSRMTCLHFECYHQPQKEKVALSLNRRNHSPAPSPSLGPHRQSQVSVIHLYHRGLCR